MTEATVPSAPAVSEVRRAGSWVLTASVVLLIVWVLLPIYLLMINALSAPAEVTGFPKRFWPSFDLASMSFFFNFSHNVLKGTIVDALLWGQPWRLALNDLLCGVPRGGERSALKEKLARTLMGYARANPHRIRGRLMPVIVYDPAVGHRAFALTMRKLRDGA